jgi:anthranilate 1,2-dioxygenase large subunit/terephthalate 1,2-dioxygenase oxygenase component alpha subunit
VAAVAELGGSHASFSYIDKANTENDYAAMGIRSDKEDFALKDQSLLDNADEFGDGCHMQILSVFPNLVLQQIQNALAVRQVLPKGQMQTALNWTTFGFADDTPEMKTRRLRQNNLAGPAGYVSMEDGAVGGFVQRGIAAADDATSVIEMGGSGAETSETRATEASVRGFWKAWRDHMGV